MRRYKIIDLMKRYNIGTPQGVRKFVKTNINEINADGEEHAKVIKGEWIFDEEAVRIMDDLRDTNNIMIIEENDEQLKELRDQNEQLKQFLMATQSKLIETQEQLIESQKQLSETQRQLTESERLRLTNHEQLTVTKVANKEQENRIVELESQVQQGLKAIETLEKLRNRSLFERLLNKDIQ